MRDEFSDFSKAAGTLQSLPRTGSVFYLDLRGLDYLALASWAAILRGTHEFRNKGAHLRVDAGERNKRLLEMTTLESDRTNLELV